MYSQPTRRNRRRMPHECTPKTVLSTHDLPPNTFAVIDPFSKKLFIPLQDMIDTRAMHREGVPSLCRVFLEGRCRQGANCFQAHAMGEVVQQLRAVALAEPSCCKIHNAPSDDRELPPDLTIVLHEESRFVGRVGLSHVVVTKGLREAFAAQSGANTGQLHSEVIIPVTSLCRLHAAGREGQSCCRFGNDCMFVHLCRQVTAELLCSAAVVTQLTPCSCLPVVERRAVGCEVAAARAQRPHESPEQITFTMPTIHIPPSITMCTSADAVRSPLIHFDPFALAATAPAAPYGEAGTCGALLTSKSLNATPNGTVWRHNPYVPSHFSSTVET